MAYHIDIDEEVYELGGVFPSIGRSDFFELDNGNVGAVVYYQPDDRSCPEFEVLIEFPQGYPDKPPSAWVMDPDIDSGTPHTWGTDSDGNMKICYIKPSRWSSDLTSYDSAAMIKTWIFAYCNYRETGDWAWEGVGLWGHLLP
jgi:hypothetical protein